MEGEAGEEHRKVGLGTLAMMQMRGSTPVYRAVQFGGELSWGQLWMAADGLSLLERCSLNSNPCLYPALWFLRRESTASNS